MLLCVVFLPLVASLGVGLSFKWISHRAAGRLTCGAMLISCLFACIVFYYTQCDGRTYYIELWEWLYVGHLRVPLGIWTDSLTATMLVVVTIVSCVVHFYSLGYMHDDRGMPRFMSLLSLFTFFMLMLVVANNFVQLFLGWEGVGVCSYLLIGFWYEKPVANKAAMKAFLVNRIADIAFVLGIAGIFWQCDTVLFEEVFAALPSLTSHTQVFAGIEVGMLDFLAILLFIGCMGKSAQIGLHVWLADAMEGPTPVSALIHAATMVTAGVFLVARCSPLFELAPVAREMIVWVGGLTCFLAATIAVAQYDIKRIIAYSTCSQLGYMFFACGVGAYSAGIFHLMTHAFFKALLFLGSGSVIHALSGEQDIRNMGGIWRKIPYTYAYFWIGSLALAGIFPFAGYFSKDVIIEAAYASGTTAGDAAFWMGVMGAFLTAFYSWRLIFVAFHGEPRASHKAMAHLHESPKIMIIPLVVLAAGALLSGVVGDTVFHMVDPRGTYWHGALALGDVLERVHTVPTWVKFLPTEVALAGIVVAYGCYMGYPRLPGLLQKAFKPLFILLNRKYFVDELYDRLWVMPTHALGQRLWQVFDVLCIDGYGPGGIARLSRALAGKVRQCQSGYIYHYVLAMMISLVVLVNLLLLMLYY